MPESNELVDLPQALTDAAERQRSHWERAMRLARQVEADGFGDPQILWRDPAAPDPDR